MSLPSDFEVRSGSARLACTTRGEGPGDRPGSDGSWPGSRETQSPPGRDSSVSGQGKPGPANDEGPAVVFLHAGVADRRSWATTIPGWRSITWDRRGFGASTWSPEPWDPVVDLWAVLDAVGAPDAVLVGNSQGGRVAIDAALAHPERVRGLVLIAAAIGGAPEPPVAPEVEALVAAFEEAEAAGDVEALNLLEVRCWLDGPRAPEGRVGGPARELLLAMNRRALTAPPVGEEHRPEPAWPRLHKLAVPTRVIVGTLDLPHVIANAHHLARTVPGAELVVWEGVGHLPSLECPERLDEEIAEFLATL